MHRLKRAGVLARTALLLAVTACPGASLAARSPPQPFSAAPAADALRRLLGPAHAKQIVLKPVTKGAGKDRFEVWSRHGRLVLSGTTPAVMLAGFGWYLEHTAHTDISLDGSSLSRLPAQLPLPRSAMSRTANVAHRFALNDTNEGYAGAYIGWAAWQHRIDVLALRGFNEVLVYEGQEAAYQRAFEQFGYAADEIRNWVPQPAHQPWWLLQNICCIGSPVSQQLIDAHARLGRLISDRLRELGMTPVLPGYYGTVPPDFVARNAGARTVPQGDWNALPRPDWLDPTNAYFAKVAAAYYQAQSELFGDSTMYKMDLLHEGGTAGSVNVTMASQAVQAALESAHPGAIWAILGWEQNPLPATLAAVDRSRMLVLDGISDRPEAVDRDKDFLRTPYAFGTIWNYGGHTNIGAGVAEWNRKFHTWHDRGGTALDGIALMPEAIDNNPAAVAFFADMAWEDTPVDLHAWFADYATARYGGADPHAQAAWRILADTVYSWPSDVDTRQPMGLFSAQPGLLVTAAAMPYEPTLFAKALAELLKVNPELRNSTAYHYDLVDVARQVVANHTRTLLPAINAAYQARDLGKVERLTGQWLRQLTLLDELLGTDSHFLFGAWQRAAELQGVGPAEAAALRYDVRSLVTGWAAGTTLQDYACRDWNGLVGDYYAGRWRTFFGNLITALKTNAPIAAIDWSEIADQWARNDTEYPSKPRGNAYVLASRIAGTLADQ